MEHLYNTLEQKRFICPTRLYWGREARMLVFDALKDARSVGLVVDQALEHHPFVREVLPQRLPLAFIHVVRGEPKGGQIEDGAASLPVGLDALVALGGGSTLDAAKALRAHLAFGTWGVKDRPVVPGMPRLVAIPTLPASGSEASRYYVITDGPSGEKRAYRAWSVAPDCALLDPLWTEALAPAQLLPGVFDAFTHLWESFLCRQERSWLNDALCLEGLTRILPLADALARGVRPDEEARLEMHYVAALGGMALSNVRTGLLHDAGEALAAQTPMAHPLTLMVFLEAALALYATAVEDRLVRLRQALQGTGWEGVASSTQALGTFWVQAFERQGGLEPIRLRLLEMPPDPEPIVQKILSDGVLVNKESPRPLNEALVRAFVAEGLGRWKESGHV